jgi:hypothetical protein
MTATTYAVYDDFVKRYSGGRTADSTVVQSYLDTAARILDGLTRRPPEGAEAFSPTAAGVVRSFDDNMAESGIIEIDDCLAVTQITRGQNVVTSTFYQLWPYNPGTGPYTRILLRADAIWPQIAVITPSSWYNYPYPGVGAAQIQVTGTWGYCQPANRPSVIKEATLAIAKQLYDEGAYTAKDMMQAVQNPMSWVDKRVYQMLSRSMLIRAEDGSGLFA